MRQSGKMLVAGLASTLAAIFPGVASAAEGEALAQDLTNVNASGQVAARWLKEPDSYTLQVVIERSKPRPHAIRSAATERTELQQSDGRSGFFIGNTIENLRGLDPVFSCNRTLTMVVDGRRTRESVAGRDPPNAPYNPKVKTPRVEVWLLKADGTHIPPADFSCHAGSAGEVSASEVKVSYKYLAADGGQAVAAAIRIDDAYYIEKLQPIDLEAAR